MIARQFPVAKPKVKELNLNNHPFGGPGLPGDVKVDALGRNAVWSHKLGCTKNMGSF